MRIRDKEQLRKETYRYLRRSSAPLRKPLHSSRLFRNDSRRVQGNKDRAVRLPWCSTGCGWYPDEGRQTIHLIRHLVTSQSENRQDDNRAGEQRRIPQRL